MRAFFALFIAAMAVGISGCEVFVKEEKPADVHVNPPAKAPDVHVVTPPSPNVHIDVNKK
jgi:hypothetical protein